MKIKQFGKYPQPKHFTPPEITRGGNKAFFEKPEEEPLTGEVHGYTASQGEERFSRTLNKGIKKGLVEGYYFRYSPGVPRNVVGWKELDFLVGTYGRVMAISVKGEDFVHKSGVEKEQDRVNELIILSRLREMGFEVNDITSISSDNLISQEQSDKLGRQLGVYR